MHAMHWHTEYAERGERVSADDGPLACSGLPTAGYSPDELPDTLGGGSRWVALARRREHHATLSGADQSFSPLALRHRPA